MASAKTYTVLEISVSIGELVLNCTVNTDLAGNYTSGVFHTGLQTWPPAEQTASPPPLTCEKRWTHAETAFG